MKKRLMQLLRVGVVGVGMGGLSVGAAGSGIAGPGGTVTPMADSFWTDWHNTGVLSQSYWDGRQTCRWQREYVQFSPQTGDYSVMRWQTATTYGNPCPSP